MTSSTLNLSNKLLLGELMKRASHRRANDVAVVYQEERRTFQELDDTTSQLAGWLQEQGIEKEDKVAFMLKNSLAFTELAIGIPLLGAVGVPINFRLGKNGVEYIVNHSDAKMLVIDAEYIDLIHSIKDNLKNVEKILVVGGEDNEIKSNGYIRYDSIYEAKSTYKPCESLTEDDPSFIMYTSGTTGRPKGAVMTHKNFYQNAMNIIYYQHSEMYESQLLCAPQFHIAALLLVFKSLLVNGKTVIHRDYHPVSVLEAIQQEKINTIFLVPAMWNFLFQIPNIADYDLSSIWTCATGAAITPLELKKRILHHFPNAILVDHFGQTETTATTTILRGEEALKKPTSVGQPNINVEIRVVDEEVNDVDVGEVGEIVYRGPTVMKEYYKNEAATKEAFKSGWFHSGDLVRVDEKGFIYVVDRKVDMINSGGENIYPAEVEEILYQMDGILECAVVGMPDEKWGQSVTAIVALKPEKSISEKEIIQYCKGNLAKYKKPQKVRFVDALPRNASGKVLKYKLQEINDK